MRFQVECTSSAQPTPAPPTSNPTLNILGLTQEFCGEVNPGLEEDFRNWNLHVALKPAFAQAL